jgi:AcrR family transcriptional regulator
MVHSNEVTRPAEARDVRQTRTRAALAEALLSMLEQGPFEQVTIREITARAGVGYATFFRHYADKQALLHDLAERQIGELLAMAMPILYTVDTRASARALCAYVWEYRKLWSALLTGGAAGILRQEFVRQTRQIAAKQNNPELSLPNDLRIVFSVTGTLEILAWWLKQSEPLSINRMAEILDQLVVQPSMAGVKSVKL